MPLTTVVLDLGETLVDETSLWEGWARFLDVPVFTLCAVIGGVVARGLEHTAFLDVLRPGEEHTALIRAKEAEIPWELRASDLYDDALPCLYELAEDGWQVVVGGNQPEAFQRLVEHLDLPIAMVTSSGELGVAKPDPAFYETVATKAGVRTDDCVHVGDRVDNDVDGAQAAGMTPVHLRRGPWGLLFPTSTAHQVGSLTELPALLRGLR